MEVGSCTWMSQVCWYKRHSCHTGEYQVNTRQHLDSKDAFYTKMYRRMSREERWWSVPCLWPVLKEYRFYSFLANRSLAFCILKNTRSVSKKWNILALTLSLSQSSTYILITALPRSGNLSYVISHEKNFLVSEKGVSETVAPLEKLRIPGICSYLQNQRC